MNLQNTGLGLAIVAAMGVLAGAFITDLLGWVDLDAWDYLLTAVAGFVGGYLGWYLRRKT